MNHRRQTPAEPRPQLDTSPAVVVGGKKDNPRPQHDHNSPSMPRPGAFPQSPKAANRDGDSDDGGAAPPRVPFRQQPQQQQQQQQQQPVAGAAASPAEPPDSPPVVELVAERVDEEAEANMRSRLQDQAARLAQMDRERETQQLAAEQQQLTLEMARLKEREQVLALRSELQQYREGQATPAAAAVVERVVVEDVESPPVPLGAASGVEAQQGHPQPVTGEHLYVPHVEDGGEAGVDTENDGKGTRRLAVGILLALVVIIVAVGVTAGLLAGGGGNGGDKSADVETSADAPTPATATSSTKPPTSTSVFAPPPPPGMVVTTTMPTLAPTSQPKSLPVFRKPENIVWRQLGSDLEGAVPFEEFGHSVALSADGTIMAVGRDSCIDLLGCSGVVRHVKVFQYKHSSSTWKQLGSGLVEEASGDFFGNALSLSANGMRIAIAALGNDGNGRNSGHVRVFEYSSDADDWNQLGDDIDGEAAGDLFGSSVALSADGTILAVGADANDGNGDLAGHARVFRYDRPRNKWDPLGSDLDGEAGGDRFGKSVALSADGTILAAGANKNSGNGNETGHVQVLEFNSTTNKWNRLGSDLDGEGANDWSGYSVDLSADGLVVAVGAPLNHGKNGMFSGHVRVFRYDRSNDKWNRLGQDLDGEAALDLFGETLALSADGSILAVGGYLSNGSNGDGSGHVRLFQYDGSTDSWNQLGPDLDGEAEDDEFGRAVALSSDGTIVAAGAVYNDGGGNDAGHVRAFRMDATNA